MYGLIGMDDVHVGPARRPDGDPAGREGLGRMPGCLSYVVAHDPADADTIWVTEVWTDEAAHRASLQVPQVREAIRKAMPLIATFGDAQVTTPVGGVGVAQTP